MYFTMKVKKYDSLGFSSRARVLKELEQVGKSDKLRDETRTAYPPGKRVSKNGNVYWETRKNRSDVRGKKI